MGKRLPKALTARSEHLEQVALFEWAAYYASKWPCLALMYSYPISGLRNIVVAKKLRAEGAKPGVPDIFLPFATPYSHGLYIELKRVGGPKPTKTQLDFHARLRGRGYTVSVCYGCDEAIRVIQGYLR